MCKKKCIVKKIFFIFIILFLVSCSNNLSEEKSSFAEEKDTNLKTGYLSLSIKSDSISSVQNARSILTSDEIDSLVNTYEIILFNQTEHNCVSIKKEDAKISIPEGTWNILCLAGTKKCLIGSGFVNNVVIEANKVSQVEINMYLLDISMSSNKSELNCNESYSVSVSVDTKNPYLIPDYVYANKKRISLKGEGSAGSGSMEYLSANEEKEFSFCYTTSSVTFKTETFNCKLEDCSSFTGIINSSIIDREGITTLKLNFLKAPVSTGAGLSIIWVE